MGVCASIYLCLSICIERLTRTLLYLPPFPVVLELSVAW